MRSYDDKRARAGGGGDLAGEDADQPAEVGF